MFFLIDIIPMHKVLLKIQGKCETCEEMGAIELIKSYHCLRLFFIPLFKWHVAYYLKHSCGGIVPVSEDVALNITYGKVDLGTLKFQHTTSKARTCKQCGQILDPEFTYCPYCGQSRK